MNIKSMAVTGFLVGLGSLQMLGDLTGWGVLKAVALATHASPAPKVFTAQEGFETFSSTFYLDWIEADGETASLQLTPTSYRDIRGPYNRRNAYGAAISYGPVLNQNPLTRPMFESAVKFTFCTDRSLLQELPLPTPLPSQWVVRIVPRDSAMVDTKWQLLYPIECES